MKTWTGKIALVLLTLGLAQCSRAPRHGHISATGDIGVEGIHRVGLLSYFRGEDSLDGRVPTLTSIVFQLDEGGSEHLCVLSTYEGLVHVGDDERIGARKGERVRTLEVIRYLQEFGIEETAELTAAIDELLLSVDRVARIPDPKPSGSLGPPWHTYTVHRYDMKKMPEGSISVRSRWPGGASSYLVPGN